MPRHNPLLICKNFDHKAHSQTHAYQSVLAELLVASRAAELSRVGTTTGRFTSSISNTPKEKDIDHETN